MTTNAQTSILNTQHNHDDYGEFKYISSYHERVMMTNAWQAITQTETWDFVKQDIDSFMFSLDPQISIISNKMEELGYKAHSGTSFGWVMRNMQYIAKHGETKFHESYLYFF